MDDESDVDDAAHKMYPVRDEEKSFNNHDCGECVKSVSSFRKKSLI